MRVGAFARGLLLKGECSVELILMIATKPTNRLFNDLASSLPAKFEVGLAVALAQSPVYQGPTVAAGNEEL